MKKKITSVIALTALVACYVPAHALVVPASFDFGTDSGKTTYGDAGFTDASETGVSITDQPDSVNFLETADGGVKTGGITRTFTGLGGGERNDFTITSEFSLATFRSWVTGTRPGGILLFADSSSLADINGTGLAVQIHSTGSFTEEELRITNGIDGSVLASVQWADGEIAGTNDDDLRHPDVLEWKVDVSFSGTDTMDVNATLTRLEDGNGTAGDSQSVSFSTNDASSFIGGDHFGFGGRYRDGDETNLNSYSVIPEPSTYALLFGGLAFGLILLRRRRK